MASQRQQVEDVEPNLDVNELAKPFNLSTDGNPFDMDAILDAIPEERRGIKYTDGWDPTRLEEELKQHPFFMKELPKDGEPLPPLLEALQQLKYAEDENTPEELALNYKEDGNFHFKLKKYRIAVACFTEAIRKATMIEDKDKQNGELFAQLYNNRAAAQFHLENYRSCLLDCQKSISYKNDYFKPIFKAIEAAIKIRKWRKALEFCTKAEQIQPTNSEVQRLRLLVIRKMKLDDATDRKNEFKKKAKAKMFEEIMEEIRKRKIKCRSTKFLNEETETGKHVKVGEDGCLEWPVFMCYPQYSQSDFIESFHENSTFLDHITEMFDNDRPAWDLANEYHSDTLDIYYVDFQTCGYVPVDPTQSLLQVLQDKTFELPVKGVPTFFVMARNEMCKVLYERVQAAANKA